MAEVGKIAKLFGFIGKNTSMGEHLSHAALGAGARAVYNVVQGNDLTDGMATWAVGGAAAGVGWKTYQNASKAGAVSSAMGRMEKAAEAMRPLKAEARGLAGEARKAKAAQFMTEHEAYAAAKAELNGHAQAMGLSVKANTPATKGGVINESVKTSQRGTTVAASKPVMPVGQKLKRPQVNLNEAAPRNRSFVDKVQEQLNPGLRQQREARFAVDQNRKSQLIQNKRARVAGFAGDARKDISPSEQFQKEYFTARREAETGRRAQESLQNQKGYEKLVQNSSGASAYFGRTEPVAGYRLGASSDAAAHTSPGGRPIFSQ